MELTNCFKEIFSCIFLALTYVGSLYIWTGNQGRDHPLTIKKRCFSVLFMNFISALYVLYYIGTDSSTNHSVLHLMGLRLEGIITATILPMTLTTLLFLGPIVQNHLSVPYLLSIKIYFEPNYWYNTSRNPIWWRNQIVAPFSEEFTFRACMLTILTRCLRPSVAIFMAPLFFGIAHFHHAIEQIKKGLPIANVLFISFFQFLYTSLFGFYSAFLFVRTGHFLPLFLAHAFCNHMGLPDLKELVNLPEAQKWKTSAAYVFGLVSWYFLLYPLTEPSLYSNVIYNL